MKNKKRIIALILNIVIIVMEIIGSILSIQKNGITFNFYTEDSNNFAMIVSLIFVIATITNIITKKEKLPKFVKLLKYMATTSLTVTFLVVIFILVPTMKEMGGFEVMMFKGSMLYHHTLCPIIAIISFIFFEECDVKGFKDNLFAIIFTIIYAIISVTLNIAGIMYGPYPFLHVYEQPVYMSVIWCIVIVGGSYVIAWGLGALSRKFSKKSV